MQRGPKPHVFQNFRGRKTPYHVISQAKPHVGSYSWIPNQNLVHRTQPHENGTFFLNLQRTGQGSVGVSPFDSIAHTQPVSMGLTSMIAGQGSGVQGAITAANANAAFNFMLNPKIRIPMRVPVTNRLRR